MRQASYRRRAVLAALLLGTEVMLVAGCSPGIRWHGAGYASVQADSARDQKLTFVYFRNWAMVECTDFEENVLKDPAVREILRPDGAFYCVALEYYWDRPLADDWGVEAPPAVVVLDPQQHIVVKLCGKMSVKELLTKLRRAQETFMAGASASPAR